MWAAVHDKAQIVCSLALATAQTESLIEPDLR